MKKPLIISGTVLMLLVVGYLFYKRTQNGKKTNSTTDEAPITQVAIGNTVPNILVKNVQGLINGVLKDSNQSLKDDGIFGEKTQEALAAIGYPDTVEITPELAGQLKTMLS